eukprot:m.354822 g.354822  ORF g.354822 m.354822 type:complete len:184 (-) comp17110_c0_seq1:236-787(-)
MALVAQQVGLRATGTRARVPDDPISLLQYYLGCVKSVLDVELPRELCDYGSRQISRSAAAQVIQLANMLSPDVLEGKTFFTVPAGHPMLQGSSNKFYELTQATTAIAVADSVVIGGQRRRVTKFMVHTKHWVEENWINPMLLIAVAMKEGDSAATPPSRTARVGQNNRVGGRRGKKNDSCVLV